MVDNVQTVLDGYACAQGALQGLRASYIASKQTNKRLDHILVYGRPGMGKTRLAKALARELGKLLITFTGKDLCDREQLNCLIKTPEQGAILFIDEIHSVRPSLLEALFNVMEYGTLPDPHTGADVLLFDVTVIGATTEMGALSAAMRSRFPLKLAIDGYTDDALSGILLAEIRAQGYVGMQPAALTVIVKRAKGSPRIAKQLLKIANDFSVAAHLTKDGVTESFVASALKSCGYFETGLDMQDVRILSALSAAECMGLSNLAAQTDISAEALRCDYEPYLISKGYMQRTSSGRVLTELGKSVLTQYET